MNWCCVDAIGSRLLDLAHDLAGLAEGLNHLLALLPPANGVVAFLEEVVDVIGPVHVLQQFALHFVLCESIGYQHGSGVIAR